MAHVGPGEERRP